MRKSGKELSRREFVKQSSGAITCGMMLSLLEGCSDDSSEETVVGFSIDLTDPAYSSLGTEGGAIVKNGIAVIRTIGDEYVALSTRCTHQGCTVSYSSGSQQLNCPCHGSRFDSNGNVLQGPATQALPRYSVSVSENTLTVNPNVLI